MNWFLSPLAWLLLAGAVMLLAAFRRWRWLQIACSAVVVVALVAMTPLGSNLLLEPLERPVATPPACNGTPPSTVVVPGGGIDGRPRDRDDFSVLNLASRRRMDRAIAWWREGDGRVLVLQGGAPYGGSAVAELMAAYAEVRGIPPTVIRVETRSDDTWENAHNAALLSPRLPRRIVLITSLVHMPRARSAFANAGFEVCPLGTDARRLPSRLPWALVPRTRALANTEAALHEWIGLIYYRWRGRHAEEPADATTH